MLRKALIMGIQYTSGDQEWSKSPSLTEMPCAGMNMKTVTYEPAADAIDRLDSADSRRIVGILLGQAVGAGSFGDVFKGSFCSNSTMKPRSMAVKVVRRAIADANTELQQNLKREVAVWQTLKHPNVVPFCGVSFDLNSPALISLWMSNGDAFSYLAQNPKASRMKLIEDATHGLVYLHSHRVIHGDLKAANLLVDNLGIAHLADFGLSRMLQDDTLWSTSLTTIPGTVRWMAPELLDGTQEKFNEASDVYAFAITCWELMTVKEPFYEYHADSAVVAALMIDNKRPSPKPDKLTPDIWMDIQRWWDRDPSRRPDMRSISKRLADSCKRKDSPDLPHVSQKT